MKIKTFVFLASIILIFSGCQNEVAEKPEEIAPFETPFGVFNFKRPEFPNKSVSIADYGAKPGGEVMNTEAINKAIKELSAKGGGKVIVPEGKWLTGPIVLLSNINLYLEEGSELLFSQNFDDYLPAVLTNMEGSEVYSYSPFIYAYKQENIAITGKGTLNGQGKPWWIQRATLRSKKSKGNLHKMNNAEVPVKERIFDNLDNFLGPTFFGPLYCENILLEGIRFEYGAFWTVNPNYCKNVIVRNIYILTHGEYGNTPNGDGINPNSCENVLIEYNTLDTGDDCITIKSSRDKDGRRLGIPCKNILIRYNKGLQGHGGVVIGSEMSGGIENVYAHDCEFYGTDRAVRLKTGRGRGAYIKNCWFKNMKADTIEREAIRINMFYEDNDPAMKEVNEGTPVIENIHIENFSCNHTKRNIITITGIPEMPIRNVTIKNVQVNGNKGLVVLNAENVKFENITLGNTSGTLADISQSDSIVFDGVKITETEAGLTPFVIKDVNNISIEKLETTLEDNLVSVSGKSENAKFDKSIPENKVKKEL